MCESCFRWSCDGKVGCEKRWQRIFREEKKKREVCHDFSEFEQRLLQGKVCDVFGEWNCEVKWMFWCTESALLIRDCWKNWFMMKRQNVSFIKLRIGKLLKKLNWRFSDENRQNIWWEETKLSFPQVLQLQLDSKFVLKHEKSASITSISRLEWT